MKYKRVLLKISGESLCEPGGFGIDDAQTREIAEMIAKVCKTGAQVAIVVGGGNLLRGKTFSKDSYIPRATADYMGMLATVMNATALREGLAISGQPARVLSAIEVPAINERFVRRNCISYLEQNSVTILAGGTGNPFFSTDTCAALRAAEIDADVIIKATKVDGVFTDDPVTNPSAELIPKITYQDILHKDLKVIDHAAISICRENNIPIRVINIFKENNISDVLAGKDIGTLISNQ
ncbi:UMP kinase [Limihaloglobus sulfuriphilus]